MEGSTLLTLKTVQTEYIEKVSSALNRGSLNEALFNLKKAVKIQNLILERNSDI